MAIRLGLSAKELGDPLLYSYPTNASDVSIYAIGGGAGAENIKC